MTRHPLGYATMAWSLSLFGLLAGPSVVHGQINRVTLGFGGVHDVFQDARFSDSRYSGSTWSPDLSFEHVGDKRRFGASVSAFVGATSTQAHDHGYDVTSFRGEVSYLRAVRPNLYAGGGWTVFEYLRRATPDLGNNATYAIGSSDLKAAGVYRRRMGGGFQGEVAVEVGLVSYTKDVPSFTFFATQEALESGRFDVQNESMASIFSLDFYQARPFWKQQLVETRATLEWGRRARLSYEWDMRRGWADSGPTVSAVHRIVVGFNVVSRGGQGGAP